MLLPWLVLAGFSCGLFCAVVVMAYWVRRRSGRDLAVWAIGLPLAVCGLAALDAWRPARAVDPPPAESAPPSESAADDEPTPGDGEASADAPAANTPHGDKLPPGWPPGHPVPLVKSNCAQCHLFAGRELTRAVVNFSRSVHDLHELTCSDCHGGNREDDAHAHEDEFGFIGTKLSAHIKKCSECHDGPAAELAAGPHHWDFSTRINTKYPMCVDCHGNHDVGNPPPDFSLRAVCEDCHHEFDTDMPVYAALVDENDRLWQTLIRVRRANLAQPETVPAEFQEPLAALRTETMHHVHGVGNLDQATANELNQRAIALRSQLEDWIKAHAAPDATGP